jgi:hypothetical protein
MFVMSEITTIYGGWDKYPNIYHDIFVTGTHDFLGINFYTALLGKSGVEGYEPSRYRDSGVILTQDAAWPASASSWLRVRTCLYIPVAYLDWLQGSA